VLNNNKAYLANGADGLSIVDLSKDEIVGSIKTGDIVRDIIVENSIAYVASSTKGLVVIDLDMF